MTDAEAELLDVVRAARLILAEIDRRGGSNFAKAFKHEIATLRSSLVALDARP